MCDFCNLAVNLVLAERRADPKGMVEIMSAMQILLETGEFEIFKTEYKKQMPVWLGKIETMLLITEEAVVNIRTAASDLSAKVLGNDGMDEATTDLLAKLKGDSNDH